MVDAEGLQMRRRTSNGVTLTHLETTAESGENTIDFEQFIEQVGRTSTSHEDSLEHHCPVNDLTLINGNQCRVWVWRQSRVLSLLFMSCS